MASSRHQCTLSNGSHAFIEPDPHFPDCWLLSVDGTDQSQVNLDFPDQLNFEYIRRMGNVIDLFVKEFRPITAIHLGAGALTLPRYIATTRPGSTQQVIELFPDLVDFVREHLPLPKNMKVRFRYGDAREVAGKLPKGLIGVADLIISDIFHGPHTPTHVTSVEYYEQLEPFLSDTGVLMVNIADAGALHFARATAATLQEVFPSVSLLCQSSVFKGNRMGNFVFVASKTPLDDDIIRQLKMLGPFPTTVMVHRHFDQFASSGQVIRDDSPMQTGHKIIHNFFDERAQPRKR